MTSCVLFRCIDSLEYYLLSIIASGMQSNACHARCHVNDFGNMSVGNVLFILAVETDVI